ncbi:MAG TPA: RNA methyltransferase [Cytophagales bacterium]|nr:RNA methyltransferase [Cytophagales bacterium]
MISKSWLKLIKSLQIKKFRTKEGLFLVEGAKSVLELLNSDFKIKAIFCTASFHEEHSIQLTNCKNIIEIVKEEALEGVGTFSTNNAAIAVVNVKPAEFLSLEKNEFGLMLDEVKDPGNLGTIIRIADWYGIKKIICSRDCVDFYNPKVISSTMGSFTRINIFYTDLIEYLSTLRNPPMLIGAFMNGKNIHNYEFPDSGFIVMGNESSGISKEIEHYINEKITIPNFGTAESLNVAIATAIVLDNMKRKS